MRDRLTDFLGFGWQAWRLGAFALLMMAIGVVGAAIPVGLVLALVTVPFEPSETLLVQLIALAAVPVGVGASIPYLRSAVAEYEQAEAERRGRALRRELSRYP